jgi:hypothetical protein
MLALVCILGALLMTVVGLDLHSAVDLGSSEFREAYGNGEQFVLHGTITREFDVDDEDDFEWGYLVQPDDSGSWWPASVYSEFDLGEVGDEIYFKAVRRTSGGPVIPEMYSVKAESGPISPAGPWIGLAMVVLGLSGLVHLKRSKKGTAMKVPS